MCGGSSVVHVDQVDGSLQFVIMKAAEGSDDERCTYTYAHLHACIYFNMYNF